MALLIDTPRWPWRGHMWAHLISDTSLDELHEAARSLRLRWLLFGRDHYDVPDVAWDQACELATLVDSRVIVRSLRSSGLRVPGGKPKKAWKPRADLPERHRSPAVERWLADLAAMSPGLQRDVLVRPGECVVLHVTQLNHAPQLGVLGLAPTADSSVVETVNGDHYSVELVLRAPAD